MEGAEETAQGAQEKPGRSAAQRRAETRRRRLLMNSEDRMNRIVGYSKGDGESSEERRVTEPRFHLDLDGSEARCPTVSSKRVSPYVAEGTVVGGGSSGHGTDRTGSSPFLERREEVGHGMEDEARPQTDRRSLHTFLSRLDDGAKLRAQPAGDKSGQDGAAEPEQLDSFRLVRLMGSMLLAIFVRVCVCQYLSIFAPFLTLELAYMGLYKYFPKVEKKVKSTVLTAALLLSGIPAEVINRSMDTYRRMGDVFADLCIYFFTFITCHELMLLFGSEAL